MKKTVLLMSSLLCVGLICQPALASIEIRYDDMDAPALIAAESSPTAYDMEFTGDGRNSYLIKRYELPAGVQPLFDELCEYGGNAYELAEVLAYQQPATVETKTVFETGTIATDSDSLQVVLATAPPLMEYSRDGYTGQLMIDPSSINTVASGTTGYSYQTRSIKEYSGFDRADISYIPKTITDEYGRTLSLANVEWRSLGGTQRGDAIVPGAYTATATYTGTVSGTKATGYLSTFYYTGTVTREIPGPVTYTVIYQQQANATPLWKTVLVTGLLALGVGMITGMLLATAGESKKRKQQEQQDIQDYGVMDIDEPDWL